MREFRTYIKVENTKQGTSGNLFPISFLECGTSARVHAGGYPLDTEVGQQVLWIHECDPDQKTIS
jgi:hypothetical protein